MDVEYVEIRVRLVWIVNTVPVMDVDVDVKNPLDIVPLSQHLYGDPYVVENAKAGRRISGRMMQSSYWVESMFETLLHNLLEARQARTDSELARFEDAMECG